jgi:hypothetical protein
MNTTKHTLINVSLVTLALTTALLQSCSDSLNSDSTVSESSKGSYVLITVNDNTQAEIKPNEKYSVLIRHSNDQIINPDASSITAISGSCPANNSWAPLNQQITPWQYTENGVNKNYARGINLAEYPAALATQMIGCQWKGCITTNKKLQSCITMYTTPPPVSLTCDPAARPADSTLSKSCATLLGNTYTGNYTETTLAVCNQQTWSTIVSNNSSQICQLRTCTTPKPANVVDTFNCSSLSSIFSGQYTVSKSYVCNLNNNSWDESVTSTQSQCQSQFTKLSTLPVNNGVVEIPAGTTAYIDSNIDVQQLKINGELRCGLYQSYELRAETIFVNGKFECGTETQPYLGNLTISLKRNASIIPRTGREINGSVFGPSASEIAAQKAALDASMAATVNFRAMIVTGNLRLFGVVKNKMARLSQTLNVGQNSITMDSSVNWNVGDEIAIAPTAYEDFEHEKFKIIAIQNNTITLDHAAIYKHWGGALETYAGQTKNFVLNQRAEVVNLTRNIKIESYDKLANGQDANQLNPDQEVSEPGGHVMVHMTGHSEISSVEFYKLGQAGLMGRYPFHWHKQGDTTGQYIKNSSIHRSFQRCITVHATNNTLVDNNTCYDFRGHGFFLEDSTERNNTITNNIGFAVKLPFLSKILLSSDNRADTIDTRFPAVSVFWISNPKNTVTDNIAAGSPGTGFWNSFEWNAQHTNTTEFSRNIAHSTLVGHTWDGTQADYSPPAKNPNNHTDMKVVFSHYSPPISPTFTDLVAYKNKQTGIYFRGDTVTFDKTLMADNGWSMFTAYNQRTINSVIVGKSAYVAPLTARHMGVVLYDGPFELDGVDFYNFNDQPTSAATTVDPNFSPMPFYAIGGVEKLTNLTKNLRFIPAVTYKILLQKMDDFWIDKHLSQSVRDLDGSLTGTVGGLLMPQSDFTTSANCVSNSQMVGFKVCPANEKVATFTIHSVNYNGKDGSVFPFFFKRKDGLQSYSAQDLDFARNGYYNVKIKLIDTPYNNYELRLDTDYTNKIKTSDLSIRYASEQGAKASPILKVVGYGSNCSIDGATASTSLTNLMNATTTSYYSVGSSFFIKINAATKFRYTTGPTSLTTEHDTVVTLSCAGAYTTVTDTVNFSGQGSTAPNGDINGNISYVATDGTVIGWACIKNSPAAVAVHFYSGSSAFNAGTVVGGAFANITAASDNDAVSYACSDATMSPHKFEYKPTSTFQSGQLIYVHVINNTSNPTILNSGTLRYK